MKNIFLLLFAFFLFLALSCNKNKNPVNINKSTSDSLNTYLVFADDATLPTAKKIYYNKKAFKIVLNQKNDSLNRDNLTKIATNFFVEKDWPSFKKTSEAFLQDSKPQYG